MKNFLKSAAIALVMLAFITGLIARLAAGREPTRQDGGNEDGAVVTQQDASEHLKRLQSGDLDRGEKQCGINCLYLFLKLHGKRPTIADIQQLVVVGEHGASLKSLADASCKLGLDAAPIQCRPKDWSQLSLPAIVHMERLGEEKPFLHYVLATNATEKGVEFFDPFDNRVHFFNHAQISSIFSGYCLIATPTALLSTSTIFFSLGLFLIACGVGHILTRMTRPRVTSSQLACVTGVLLLGLCGCSKADPVRTTLKPEPAKESSPPNKDSNRDPVQFDATTVDLGELQIGSIAVAEFGYVNNSTQPVRLRLRSVDCSCISTVFEPDEELPPKAKGKISLRLDTGQVGQAGVVQSCAWISADDIRYSQRLCVRGARLGLVAPQVYVIRPQHVASGQIPKLEFDIISRDGLQFDLRKVTCASVAEYSQMLTEEHDRIHTDLITPVGPLSAQLPEATTVESQTKEGELFTRRRVSIPMQLAEHQQSYTGMIVVDYSLGDQELQAVTKALIVTDKQ